MSTVHHHTHGHGTIAYCWSHGPVANPMVVLHGLGDSAIHTYAPRFASTSLQNTSTLFIDLPGFGEASAEDAYPATIECFADDVLHLLNTLQVQPASVFAHSMGANVAIQMAHNQSDVFPLLILAEPLLDPSHSVLATSIAKHSEAAFVTRRYQMLLRATSIQANRNDMAAAAFLPTLQMADPIVMYRAAQSLIAPHSPDFLTILRSIPHPRYLLVGQRTQAVIPSVNNKNIKIIRIHNAGHSMMVEQAESTAYAILEITS